MAVEHNNRRPEIAENPVGLEECERICNQELRAVLVHHALPLKELPRLTQQAANILARSKQLKTVWDPRDIYRKEIRKLAKQCLELTLKESYGIDLEKWREEHKKGSGVAGPTNEEQLQRNTNLRDFIALARKSDFIKKQVLRLTDTMLESGFPVAMWNKNEVMNDLATNFVFWAMEHDVRFTKVHKLVVYTSIYRGFDERTIIEHVKRFESKDKTDYGVTPDSIRQAYAEVASIFKRHGASFLNKFLKNVELNSNANEDLIPNYRQIVAERTAAIQDNPKELLNAASLERMDSERIVIPETALDLFLTDIDFVLLQRGNITARNKILVRIQRLIRGMVCKSQYGRSVILAYGTPADFNDIYQEVAEECLRIFSCVSVTTGGYIVYIQQRVKSIITRGAFELETLPLSSHLHEVIRHIENNPDATDEEIAGHYSDSAGRCTPKRIKKIRDKYFKGGQAVYRKVCADEPIEGKDSNDATRGDFLPELSVPAIALDVAETKEIQQLSRAVIAELPPYHRFLLEQYFLHGKTFRQIGEMIGVTRQAVEPIIDAVKDRLKEGKRCVQDDNIMRAAADAFNLGRDVVIPKNQEAFNSWCLGQCSDKKTRDAFRLYLGLDGAVGFRRLKGPEIYRQLERRSGRPISEKTRMHIKNTIAELREKLESHLLRRSSEKRCVEVIPEKIMYRRAQQYLQRLREGDALS